MPRGGSRPGERRGGRQKGVKNKTTIMLAETGKTLAEIAREHSPRALGVLLDIAENGQSEAARVSAANALLDRGYGRPPQAPPIQEEDKGVEWEDIDKRELAKLILNAFHVAAMQERDERERQKVISWVEGEREKIWGHKGADPQ